MKILKAPLLIVFFLLLSVQAHTQTCSDLFQDQNLFQSLAEKNSVTETEILRAAEDEVLGDGRLSERAKYWVKNAFAVFSLKKNLRIQSKIELRRRSYKNDLLTLNITIKADFRYLLNKYKPYLKGVLAVGANAAANYLTYHYLSRVGVIVYIPQWRFFNVREIPDEVLYELANTDMNEDAPKTRAYIFSHVKFGAQKIYDSVRGVFNIGIISTLIVFHADLITDPTGYMYHKMDGASLAINRASYDGNMEIIHELEERKKALEKSGQLDQVAQIETAIDSLKQTNSAVLNEMQQK